MDVFVAQAIMPYIESLSFFLWNLDSTNFHGITWTFNTDSQGAFKLASFGGWIYSPCEFSNSPLTYYRCVDSYKVYLSVQLLHS